MILVVDDLRVFRDDLDVVYARTLNETAPYLTAACSGKIVISELWLDHDLGQSEDIRELVDHLDQLAIEGEKLPLDCIRIISANPVGRDYITRALGRHYTIKPCTERIIS